MALTRSRRAASVWLATAAPSTSDCTAARRSSTVATVAYSYLKPGSVSREKGRERRAGNSERGSESQAESSDSGKRERRLRLQGMEGHSAELPEMAEAGSEAMRASEEEPLPPLPPLEEPDSEEGGDCALPFSFSSTRSC